MRDTTRGINCSTGNGDVSERKQDTYKMVEDNKNTDSLHSAILNNDLDKVRQLIEDGADLNSPNDEGLSPLFLAFKKNNKNIVKLLLDTLGRDNDTTEVSMTAWIYATMLDDKEIATLLLEKPFNFSKATNSQGETLVHYCVKYRSLNILNYVDIFKNIVNQVDVNGYSALHLAIIHNDVQMVKRLLELGANVYAKTLDGRSSIHFAVKYRCFDTLLMLIEANVDLNDPVTSTGERPLHIAVENDDISIVNLLIRSGANYLNCTDYEGKNLLHVAVENKHEGMIKMMLKMKVNVNARFGEKQESVLDLALSTRVSQIIKTILNHDPDLNSKNKEGLSAIFVALQYECLKGVNEIFSLKPDLDIVTNDGSTLLHYALHYHHGDIVNYLLENNINIEIVNNEGYNALHYAARYADAKEVTLLINKNFDVNAKTIYGCTALHLAMLNSSNEILHIINILLNCGAEVNAENKLKKTPLFMTADRKEVFKLLVDKGADVNHFDIKGNGLLYYFADTLSSFIYEEDVYSSLIEHNINFNKINSNNDNIIHLMAKRNLFCVKIFEQLLKSGADINGINDNNQTPLNVCLENGAFPELVLYLCRLKDEFNNEVFMIKTKEGETCLHLAIKAQQFKTVQLFLINPRTRRCTNDLTLNRSSIFHYAVKYNTRNDILSWILKYRVADIVNAKNDDGQTPLHLAVLKDSLEMVQPLINEKNIDINVKDMNDNSPLCYAIANKNLSMVKCLLKKGASTEDRHRGKSIYDLAKESGDKHIYQTVLLF